MTITNLIAQRLPSKPSFLRIVFDLDELVQKRPVVGCLGRYDRIGYVVSWDQELEELTFTSVNVENAKGKRKTEVLVDKGNRLALEPIYIPQPTPGKTWSKQYSADVFLGTKAVDTIMGPFNVGRFDQSTIENKDGGAFVVDVYPA